MAEDEVWWDEPPDFGADFATRLKAEDRVFVNKLAAFLEGDVTLDDGKQHTVLASIAKWVVEDERLPTEKQRSAFKAIFDSLMEKKKAGDPLVEETPETKEKRKDAAEILLKLGTKYIEKFTMKTREIIVSMDTQFKKKGALSFKQVKYLRFIVEQLPPKLLEEIEDEEPDGFRSGDGSPSDVVMPT